MVLLLGHGPTLLDPLGESRQRLVKLAGKCVKPFFIDLDLSQIAFGLQGQVSRKFKGSRHCSRLSEQLACKNRLASP